MKHLIMFELLNQSSTTLKNPNKVRDAMTLRNKNQGPLLALEKTTSGTYIVDLGTSQGKTTTVTISGEIDPASVQNREH